MIGMILDSYYYSIYNHGIPLSFCLQVDNTTHILVVYMMYHRTLRVYPVVAVESHVTPYITVVLCLCLPVAHCEIHHAVSNVRAFRRILVNP